MPETISLENWGKLRRTMEAERGALDAPYRLMAKEMAHNGTMRVMVELLRDLAAIPNQKIREKLLRGTAITPEDLPKLQLEQGKIQAFQQLLALLEEYQKDPEPPVTRPLDE